ncbi:hypothetical protein IAQ61_003152 [Plenodomus lingam]|nr:hypothetical protein IAQ61_003152 [Plenodomus lingam]
MLLASLRQQNTPNSNTPIRILSTFIIALILLYLYKSMSSAPKPPIPAPPTQNFHYEYTVHKGLFLQSEDDTDDASFDFRKHNFGLVDRLYPTDGSTDEEGREQWRRFERYIRSLNESVGKEEGRSVKVLLLGRHGQGWHNVAETKYGTRAWDCHYAALNGSDGLTWSDAHLTPLGHQQALDVHTLWSTQLPHGLPPPDTHYLSPLTRAIQTADLTFSHLPLPPHKPYTPLVKELLREALGIHTCDRRSTRSHLATTHPHLTFEPAFTEQDELWDPQYREPRGARRYRVAMLLDDVWEHDGGVWISMTAHSGAIASLLESLGHRAFALETGGVIPVVVEGRRVEGARRVPEREPSDEPDCEGWEG